MLLILHKQPEHGLCSYVGLLKGHLQGGYSSIRRRQSTPELLLQLLELLVGCALLCSLQLVMQSVDFLLESSVDGREGGDLALILGPAASALLA